MCISTLKRMPNRSSKLANSERITIDNVGTKGRSGALPGQILSMAIWLALEALETRSPFSNNPIIHGGKLHIMTCIKLQSIGWILHLAVSSFTPDLVMAISQFSNYTIKHGNLIISLSATQPLLFLLYNLCLWVRLLRNKI